MTSLAEHASAKTTKLLLIGESGAGKTGCLTSLVGAGYKLRVLDFDNGLDSLAWQVRQRYPDKLGNIEFRTLRDKYKSSPAGPIIDGQPKAFIEGLKMLDSWKYTSDKGEAIDLGKPSEWGDDVVLVLDSLTFFADAAFAWSEIMTGGAQGGKMDRRAIYGNAQNAVEKVLALLTAEAFHPNVVVMTHIRYQELPDGTTKGLPTAVGSALGPVIPRYFNSVALCSTGPGGKRTIQTVSSGLVDLKNPASFKMAPSLPVETALADFFKTVKG